MTPNTRLKCRTSGRIFQVVKKKAKDMGYTGPVKMIHLVCGKHLEMSVRADRVELDFERMEDE